MTKGRWIYISMIGINVILMLLPTSGMFFDCAFHMLEDFNLLTGWPDILALLSILFGYITLKSYYKKQSRYIKNYPFLVMGIFILWTAMLQIG